MIRNTRKMRGYTLTEILLVVGFISLATISTLTVSKVADHYSTSGTEARKMQALESAIQHTFGIVGFYPLVNATGLNAANATPPDLRDPSNANRIVNGFGNDITLTPATLTTAWGSTYPGFNIVTKAIPSDYCTKFVLSTEGSFDEVSIGGVVVKPVGGSVDVGATAGQCSSSSTMDVTFTSFT